MLSMHKKYFNRAAIQLLHFKNGHGAIQTNGASAADMYKEKPGPGLLVPQVRSNLFLCLQKNDSEYKMQLNIIVYMVALSYEFFKLNHHT